MVIPGEIAVVVAQEGADPHASVEALRAHTPNVVTLAQAPGEPDHEMVYRVRACVQELRDRGRRIGTAALVARPGFGLGDVPGTAEQLRALLTAMVQQGAGHIHLYSSEAVRPLALTALAETIRDQVRGTGVEIVSSDSEPAVAAVGAAPARAYYR